MKSSVVGRLVLIGAILMPALVYAQEATLTGTVSDSTGGVLPGVAVTALLEATGNTFVAVTTCSTGRTGRSPRRSRVRST